MEHRRHGGKRPLPEPDDDETAQSASMQSPSKEQRHFPRRQIVFGEGCDDAQQNWRSPAVYHAQAEQQSASAMLAYHDVVGVDSSVTLSSNHPIGHLSLAAGSPQQQGQPELAPAAAAATGQIVEARAGTPSTETCIFLPANAMGQLCQWP